MDIQNYIIIRNIMFEELVSKPLIDNVHVLNDIIVNNQVNILKMLLNYGKNINYFLSI